jgi:DNA (cytosine-5)-methyltransferase 1
MSQFVLSLFPGIGLLDMAFEQEGFVVVRGPDLLWGGDIKRFHPPAGKFDGVIGGPPCQAFSVMRYINPHAGKKHGNLIPEFERVVAESQPAWFLMENVRDAPVPTVPGFHVHSQFLKDLWVGGETMRLRRISLGTRTGHRLNVETLALHISDPEVSALAGGGGRTVPVALQRDGHGGHKPKKRYGNSGARTALGRGGSVELRLKEQLRLQGLPPDFLSEAPFTASAKCKAIGNGVPLAMGRAVARAVRNAITFPAPDTGYCSPILQPTKESVPENECRTQSRSPDTTGAASERGSKIVSDLLWGDG